MFRACFVSCGYALGMIWETSVRRRFPLIIFVMLAAVGIGGAAWWMNRSRKAVATIPPSATVAIRDTNKLTVMTANVRISDPGDGVNVWANRRELLVKTLLKYDADIIGCQEVTPAQGAYLIKELGNWYTHYPRAGVGTIEGATSSRGAIAGRGDGYFCVAEYAVLQDEPV